MDFSKTDEQQATADLASQILTDRATHVQAPIVKGIQIAPVAEDDYFAAVDGGPDPAITIEITQGANTSGHIWSFLCRYGTAGAARLLRFLLADFIPRRPPRG